MAEQQNPWKSPNPSVRLTPRNGSIVCDHMPAHPIIAERYSAIETLCRRFGVRRLCVFGSALHKGNYTTARDIDLTVDFADVEGISPAHQYFDFKAELEQLLARQVDLVELASMQDSRLKRMIERTSVLVYARSD
jgi:predicted nucleotidyltransferase